MINYYTSTNITYGTQGNKINPSRVILSGEHELIFIKNTYTRPIQIFRIYVKDVLNTKAYDVTDEDLTSDSYIDLLINPSKELIINSMLLPNESLAILLKSDTQEMIEYPLNKLTVEVSWL